MTQPRQILPQSTYFVTRRCSEQRFFLTPSSKTNHIFAFCLAWAAKAYGVQLHAFCVMSNHWHAVLTDPEGKLPDFMAHVHKYVAKCLNLSLKRRENLWSDQSYSAVRLETEVEVMDKMVYTLGNPVKAGLVRRASEWPGLTSGCKAYGSRRFVPRPRDFFRAQGSVQEQCELTVTVPPHFEPMSPTEFQALLNQNVAEYEKRCRREQKGAFLGIKRILGQSPFTAPKRLQKKFSRHVQLAGKSKEVLQAGMQRLKAFVQAYREAFTQFKAGNRQAVFPPGTYWMRLHASVCCAAAG
jgi:putative transposase